MLPTFHIFISLLPDYCGEFWRSESTRRQRRYNLSLERYMRIRDVTLMMQSSCLWADGWIMVGLHLHSFIFPVWDSCGPLRRKIPGSCDKNVSCPVCELFSNNNWGGGLFDILETVWNLVFVVMSLTKFYQWSAVALQIFACHLV